MTGMTEAHVHAVRARRDITAAQCNTLLSLVARGIVDPCREGATPAQCKLWYDHHPDNHGLGGHTAEVRDVVLRRAVAGAAAVHRKVAHALQSCGHMMPLNTYLGEWVAVAGANHVVLEAVAWIWLDACGAMNDAESFQEYHGQAVSVSEAVSDPVKLLRVLSAFKRAHDVRGFRPSAITDELALSQGWWVEESESRRDALVYAHVDETMGEHEWVDARNDADLSAADRVSSLVRVGDNGITFAHVWHLSRSVHALLTAPRQEGASLEPIAHQPLATLTDEQNAVRTAVLDGVRPVTLCCSPAGTGKTHTAAVIVDSHDWPRGVVCTAPTHKALSVLRAKIGGAATAAKVTFTTVQKLAVMPKAAPASLVVVDETSMFTMRHIKVILDIYADARILFLGDDAQLPCIGRGLPIKDLQLALDTRATLRLTKCMRTEGVELIALASAVRDGRDVADVGGGEEADTVTMTQVSMSAAALAEHVAAKIVDLLPPWHDDYVQIITSENKNVDAINRCVQTRLTGTGSSVSGCYVGDSIRMQYNSEEYKNGDEGVVAEMREKRGHGGSVKLTAVVRRKDGTTFIVDREGHMKPAYASTVHKTQGSEYPTVVLALFAQTYAKMVTREMVYTSVTRARRRISVIGHLPWLESLSSEARRTVFPLL